MDSDRFGILVEKALDGALDGEERRELASAVKADASRMAEYLAAVRLHTALAQKVAPVAEARRKVRRAIPARVYAAAAMLALAAGLAFLGADLRKGRDFSLDDVRKGVAVDVRGALTFGDGSTLDGGVYCASRLVARQRAATLTMESGMLVVRESDGLDMKLGCMDFTEDSRASLTVCGVEAYDCYWRFLDGGCPAIRYCGRTLSHIDYKRIFDAVEDEVMPGSVTLRLKTSAAVRAVEVARN
ncbi:MAG: hypothetical protein IJ802_06675 [Kiritimatiellae bacterium]|nr:hypothetical protein [Kiritimatiellia bacterium]